MAASWGNLVPGRVIIKRDAVEIPHHHWFLLCGSKFFSIHLIPLLIDRCSPLPLEPEPSGTQHLLTCSTNITIVIITAVTTATSAIWLFLCSKHCTKHFVDRSSFIAHKTLWIEMIAPRVWRVLGRGEMT